MSGRFAVPELTRGLRSFAAPRALGRAHDAFFAPLLDARRRARATSDWRGPLAAFDAPRIEAAHRATLRAFAAERFPRSAPDRRALTAQLDDACAGLLDALAVLAERAVAVRDAPDDDARSVAWEAWIVVLRTVFTEADRGWEHTSAVLAAAHRPPRGWWARVFRRREALASW